MTFIYNINNNYFHYISFTKYNIKNMTPFQYEYIILTN